MNKKEIIDKIHDRSSSTMVETLGIKIIDIGENFVSGKMPVDKRTKQPFGLLHGGASVALAETLGSIGAGMNIDQSSQSVVGIEINANHLKAIKTGPQSTSSVTKCIVQPVSLSLFFKTSSCTFVSIPPAYFGRREGCTFKILPFHS